MAVIHSLDPELWEESYEKVVPFRSMLNNENRRSVYSRHYSDVKQALIMGVGPVFLAKKERTVILTPEAEAYGLKSKFILDRTNTQLRLKKLRERRCSL